MKIEFVTEEALSERYSSGELCHFYEPPYTDMPEEFASLETQLAIRIEENLQSLYGEKNIEANYDSWADVTTRLSVSRKIVNKEFLQCLMRWVVDSSVKRCIDCTVLEDLSKEDLSYCGRFIINSEGVLAEKSLKMILK